MALDVSEAVAGLTALIDALPASLSAERDAFELRAGPFMGRELRVVEFEGREAISEPFRFDITVASHVSPGILQPLLLGQSACLSMYSADRAPRELQGVLSSVEVKGCRAADHLYVYRVRLVPRLSLLAHRKNSRIFQNESIADIIDTLLTEHGVASRWATTRKLPSRDYCVQYNESDLDFVARLLAEEGVYYYFDHPSGLLDALGAGGIAAAASTVAGVASAALEAIPGAAASTLSAVASTLTDLGFVECVVFADGTDYPPVGAGVGIGLSVSLSRTGTVETSLTTHSPVLPFRDRAGTIAEAEHVYQFGLRRALRHKSATVREYTPDKPQLYATERALATPLSVSASASLALLPSESGASLVPTPSVRVSDATAIGLPAKTYEWFDPKGTRAYEPTGDRAKRILERTRRDALRGRGESTCRGLAAGHSFQLTEHVADSLNATYVVVRVRHFGKTPELCRVPPDSPLKVYSNQFDVVPATVRYRPPLRDTRGAQVLETATVVGPAEEEIHTDEAGRVKLRFHWDRSGRKDDTASCWVRVMQSWSGPGWGFQFIPRVGMEVVVSFVFGDTDRPMVIGCAPNSLNPVAFQLPSSKSRSGIRSRSTPASTGANELSFEDLAGSEMLYLHAERNLDEVVKKDHTLSVGTGGKGQQTVSITGNQSVTIGGEQHLSVGARQVETVYADANLMITGNRFAYVAGAERHNVGGGHSLSVGSTHQLDVGGDYACFVQKNVELHVREGRRTVVGADDETTVSGSASVSTGRAFTVNASGDVVLEAGTRLRVVCGTSYVELTPEGVTVVGDLLTLRGGVTSLQGTSGSIRIEEGAVSVHAADTIELQADGQIVAASDKASLSLAASGGQASLAGDAVTLTAKGALVELDDHATVQAAEVHLNPGDSIGTITNGGATPEELKTSWVEFQLLDDSGEPVPDARFMIQMSDGAIVEGALNREGRAHVPVVPGSTSVAFIDLDAAAWGASESTWVPLVSVPQRYAVRYGDDGSTIAESFGYASFDAIWDDGENATLKARRPSSAQLFPGDVLVIPKRIFGSQSVAEQSSTEFTLTRPKRALCTILKDEKGTPRSNVTFTVYYGDKTVEGKTGDDGKIEQEVPASLETVRIGFGDGSEVVIALGGLNPMRDVPDDGASGVAQRLSALGYAPGDLEGIDRLSLDLAIRAFQKDKALEENGVLDETLFAALESAYGQ